MVIDGGAEDGVDVLLGTSQENQRVEAAAAPDRQLSKQPSTYESHHTRVNIFNYDP